MTFSRAAVGQDAGAPSDEASAAVAVAVPSDPRTERIRALIADTLDVDVEPQSLFDVALDDDAAIQLEAARIRALLHAAAEATRPIEPVTRRTRTKRPVVEAPETVALRAELAAVDPALWARQVELDRARLEFYSLSVERRAELLAAHVARREAAQPRESEEERRARLAEAERQRALEAARAARTEAERLVSEELARLIALDTRVQAVRARFSDAQRELGVARDAVFGLQRRVRDAKTSTHADADATYDDIRRALRASRQALASALDALRSETTEVPSLGADPLVDVPPEISIDAARRRRADVQRAIAAARQEEEALREERAEALLQEIDTLNRERLGLLPRLSPAKREAITGFTMMGLEQARAEVWHLSLILRFHQHVAGTWLRTVRSGKGTQIHPWQTAAVVLPLLMTVLAFIWVKRRTHPLLVLEEARLAALDRAARRTTPGLLRRVVRVLLKTHRPIEWILFYLCMVWLIPTGTQHLLEVQLLAAIAGWTLSSALVVHTINALAAGGAAIMPLEEGESGGLRLRSLRLVGRTVTAFALILVLSERLVGEGTIYSWVFSTCWFAALPVFLVLVRWWRETVFARLDRVRKKTPLQAWTLANRSGWKSFAAATIGAVQLFVGGGIKIVRRWVSTFDLARRIHAYLFRREIERIGGEHPHAHLEPLAEQTLAALHPEHECRRWLPCPSDELRDALVRRATARRGGLIAVVGPRGMGKSSLLRELAAQVGESAAVACRADTSLAELCAATRLSGAAGAERAVPSLVAIDDAQALVEPRIGGLAKFDGLIDFARAHSDTATWVFSVDASVWPLLRRARDARPMFDEVHVLEPWSEVELGALIAERNHAAGISPSYDDLLDKLPPGADELDRLDAVTTTRGGYERMLWDHVGGNPGLAMEVWRSSLGQDAAGLVHVRPLQVPDMALLERLSDPSLFVLRAVLQLAPATVDTVAQATRLRPEEVLQDFRFGRAQGFYDEREGRMVIAWPWVRAVSRLLQRRHLLVTL